MKKAVYILAGIAVLLTLALVAVIYSIFSTQSNQVTQDAAQIVDIAEQEPVSSVWGENYPNQYGSLL